MQMHAENVSHIAGTFETSLDYYGKQTVSNGFNNNNFFRQCSPYISTLYCAKYDCMFLFSVCLLTF